MGEKVLKLQERLSFQPIDTAGNQATSTLGTECESLRPPPDAYLLRRETGSQPTIAPIRTYDSTEIPFGLHDLEKGLCNWHSQPAHEISYSHSRVTYTDPEDDSDEDGPKEHAIWILIYLSALSPLLAVPVALYTLLMGTLLLLFLPLCLCLKKWPVYARFYNLLSPLLVLQLGLIYSSYDISDPVQSEASRAMVLVLVSMLSPLYSMTIAVATWVAGVFWFYTAILGNPDGKEDRDDGREAVLAVRGWWERWLIRSLEPADNCLLRDKESEMIGKS